MSAKHFQKTAFSSPRFNCFVFSLQMKARVLFLAPQTVLAVLSPAPLRPQAARTTYGALKAKGAMAVRKRAAARWQQSRARVRRAAPYTNRRTPLLQHIGATFSAEQNVALFRRTLMQQPHSTRLVLVSN